MQPLAEIVWPCPAFLGTPDASNTQCPSAMCQQACKHGAVAGVAAFVVAFTAVIVGWVLSLNYSAKLFTMTFVLVIMGSEKASGESMLAWRVHPSVQQ